MRLVDRIEQEYDGLHIHTIVADEISELIDERGFTYREATSYGCIAPPFSQFFIEFKKVLNSEFLNDDPFFQTIGNDLRTVLYQGLFIKAFDLEKGSVPDNAIGVIEQIETDNTRWVYLCTGHVWRGNLYDSRNRIVLNCDTVPHTETVLLGLGLNADGTLVNIDNVHTFFDGGYKHELFAEMMVANLLPVALESLSLLHKRSTVEKFEPSRQYKRKVKRQTGRFPNEYYLMKVNPVKVRYANMRQGRRGEARGHKVKGVLKFYWPDKPLFGHTSGAVWVPDHERGNHKKGTIRKDYEL